MTKEKAICQRSYDHDGYKKRAACVCVKNEHENEVLLISSNKNKNNWIIPGGGIEKNENPEDAAEREVYEEAGVKGRLGRLLGVFENIERKHRTNVYLFIVEQEFDEWEENLKFGRIRKWFSLDDAKQELEKHKPVQGTYLNLLKKIDIECSTHFNANSTSASSPHISAAQLTSSLSMSPKTLTRTTNNTFLGKVKTNPASASSSSSSSTSSSAYATKLSTKTSVKTK